MYSIAEYNAPVKEQVVRFVLRDISHEPMRKRKKMPAT